MPEAPLQKNHFRLSGGLNTESNEISFPDGFTTDEQNYELFVDGSRRRRKGCARETGGSIKDASLTIATQDQHTTYTWRAAGGDPSKNFIVHQIGEKILFTNDADTISTTYVDQTFVIKVYAVDPANVTDAQIAASPCQFAQGRGHLFVAHPRCRPFYLKYDADNDVFTSHLIKLRVRDFDGIDDEVALQTLPTTLYQTHEYNLRNRGWIKTDISTYFAGQAVYPAKNMLWYRGYRRQVDVLYSDLDGIQVFNHAKLASEVFGSTDAPQGSLLLDPMDTTFSVTAANNDVLEVPITTWDYQGGDLPSTKPTGTVRFEATSHGRSLSDAITISGTLIKCIIFTAPTLDFYEFTLDGTYTITNVEDSNNFDVEIPTRVENFVSYSSQYLRLGQVSGGVALPKQDGEALTKGPSAIAYHAARIWYAGIESGEWSDTIFFSKIAQRPAAYGIAYQEADPTNVNLSALSSSDGGTIVIPNLGKVQRMLSLNDKLLVFSDQGIWEIGGGRRGVFTASGYSVRKVTESECSSPYSPIIVGDRAIYTGPRGITQIAPDQFTGVLTPTSLSEALVQTLWNAIPASNQQKVQTVHDSAVDRVYFLYGDSNTTNSNHYEYALVLDMRVGAYYKYKFNESATSGILTAYSITESDSTDSKKKIKFTVQSTNNLDTCDLDQTAYLDFDGAESPLPFMVTGWDNIGDFQRRRQAPVITVYAKRTETGYTETGNGWDGDNESSSLMTAYWDWTDDSVSGKIGSQNETYRHVRGFVPSGSSDVDGYPVVVTRNKVRGRGRVLQLRFDGAATKDSHLLGFTTNYKISRGM